MVGINLCTDHFWYM